MTMLILPSKKKLLLGAATRDVAYVRRIPAGIPGTPSRGIGLATIEAQLITPFGTTGAPASYGVAGQIDSVTGQFRIINSTDTDAYGSLLRVYPTSDGGAAAPLNSGFGPGVPPKSGVCDVMVRGYQSVLLQNAAAQPAKKGGTVYVWFAASNGNHVQGGYEAAATGGSTLALPDKWYFTGGADANGNTEIAINI